MQSYFIGVDFDGTMADTAKPSPNGLSSLVTTGQAIADVMGEEGWLLYEVEGLRNRAPSEIVAHFLTQGNREHMLEAAWRFYTDHQGTLEGMVPNGKGVPLLWNETNPDLVIAELVVRQKLCYLLAEIGNGDQQHYIDGWPQPCEGFIEFWQWVDRVNQCVDVKIDRAIISSGHDTFILKVLETWGLSYPDYMVSDDHIRLLQHQGNREVKVKPDPWSLNLVYNTWIEQKGGVNRKDHALYIGDDPVKDGKMAVAAEVPFCLFDPGKIEPDFWMSAQYGIFGDWHHLLSRMSSNHELLSEGRPWREILTTNSHGIESYQQGLLMVEGPGGSPER